MLKFDPSGQLQWQQDFKQPIYRLSLDAANQSAWLATAKQLKHIQADGQLQRSLKLKDIDDLQVDAAQQVLWIARQQQLEKYSLQGDWLASIPYPHIQRILPDQAGGLWIKAKQDLYHEDMAMGQRDVEITHYFDRKQHGRLRDWLVNPANGNLWIAQRKRLQQLSRQGEVLYSRRSDDNTPPKAERLRFLALALQVDLTGPELTWLSPATGQAIPSQPALTLNYVETGIGLDIASFQLQANGQPVATQCQTAATQLNCQVIENLTAGEQTLSAIVQDYYQNLSTPATRTVQVDTTPPPAPDITKINASPINQGKSTITGQTGSVEPSVKVKITNIQKQLTQQTQADQQGQFTLEVLADNGDQLSIMAIDAAGNQSAAIQLTVGELPLAIQITSPVNGAIINRSVVTVKGTVQGSDAVLVNGLLAMVDQGQFWINNLPVPGDNIIQATVTTLDNETQSAQISINYQANGEPELVLSADTERGVAPLMVGFSYRFSQADTIQQIRMDYDSDGRWEVDSSDPTLALQHTYPAVGHYVATLEIVDTNHKTYQAQVNIVVVELLQHLKTLDATLRKTYRNMISHLQAGQIEKALNAFQPSARPRYQALFTAMGSNLQTLLSQPSQLNTKSFIDERMAEYYITREENGKTMAYPLYFFRDDDGIWRISDM